MSLFLPMSESLKDRRQIVKSVTARIAQEFNVAAAEVGDQTKWQTAEIGVSAVSNNTTHVTHVLENVVSYVERNRPDVEISDQLIEVIPF